MCSKLNVCKRITSGNLWILGCGMSNYANSNWSSISAYNVKLVSHQIFFLRIFLTENTKLYSKLSLCPTTTWTPHRKYAHKFTTNFFQRNNLIFVVVASFKICPSESGRERVFLFVVFVLGDHIVSKNSENEMKTTMTTTRTWKLTHTHTHNIG